MATPLYIEIGLHYYYSSAEFERINAPAVQTALVAFVQHGMLRKLGTPTEHGATYEATDGLKVWCQALCRVNWPTQEWVMAPPSRASQGAEE
jgi:hypothetical protein